MTTVPCPYCGQPVRLSPVYGEEPDIETALRGALGMPGMRRQPTRQTNRHVYHSDTLGAVAGGWTEEYQQAVFEQPVRAPTPQSDVAVPALQAFISGVIVSLLAGVVTVAQRWPWYVAAVAGLLALAVTWLWLLQDHRRSLWQRETYTANPDPLSAAPAAPAELKVTLTTLPPDVPDDGQVYSGSEIRYLNLPVSQAQLAELGDLDRKWSVRSLTGCAGLSENQAAELVKTMLEAGLLRYRNNQPNHPDGPELTPAGKAVVRRARGEVRNWVQAV